MSAVFLNQGDREEGDSVLAHRYQAWYGLVGFFTTQPGLFTGVFEQLFGQMTLQFPKKISAVVETTLGDRPSQECHGRVF